MAIAFVSAPNGSQNTGAGASSHSSNTFDSTGANFVAVGIACSAALSSVTDNKGNGSYTLIGPYASSTDNVYLAYKVNAAVGAGHQITANAAAGTFFALSPACFSGLATSSPFDKEAHAFGNSVALNSGATATTTQTNELCLATGTLSAGADGHFIDTGSYPVRSEIGNASTGATGFLSSNIVSATGAQTGAGFWNNGAGNWTCLVATFADTNVGAGGSDTPLAVTSGDISLSGQTVNLQANASVVLTITEAALSIQPQDIPFVLDNFWTEGSLTLSGQSVTLVAGEIVTLGVTSADLTLSGGTITLNLDVDYSLSVDSNTLTLSNEAITFIIGGGVVLDVVSSDLVLSGMTVGISSSFTLSATGAVRRTRNRGIRRNLNVGR